MLALGSFITKDRLHHTLVDNDLASLSDQASEAPVD